MALVQAAWRSLNSSVVEAVRKGGRARWRHGRAWPLTTPPTGLGACQTRGKSTPMEACRSAPAGVWWELGDGRSGRPQPRRREAPCQKPGTAPPAPPIWRSGQEGILSCLGRPRQAARARTANSVSRPLTPAPRPLPPSNSPNPPYARRPLPGLFGSAPSARPSPEPRGGRKEHTGRPPTEGGGGRRVFGPRSHNRAPPPTSCVPAASRPRPPGLNLLRGA